ncbi:unnamed protein product [Prorocentrum cordatum]|uniref:Hexosyltransferase n=1 Tax=Prorocentrum cordatum TaxID=2364126 RepID=A0ABN9SYM8_9DINO|nr:unnamed protein product [Polarella glacialis]
MQRATGAAGAPEGGPLLERHRRGCSPGPPQVAQRRCAAQRAARAATAALAAGLAVLLLSGSGGPLRAAALGLGWRPPAVIVDKASPALLEEGGGAGAAVSLLCFMVARSKGDEADLVRCQAVRRTGVFACDVFEVFSDSSSVLSEGPPVIQTSVLSVPLHSEEGVAGSLTAGFLNTEVFMKAWEQIGSQGKFRGCDWTVKVDPDALFFPSRMRELVTARGYGTGARYLWNCPDGERARNGGLALFGAVEALSRAAVEAYTSGWAACIDKLDWSVLGEDYYLQQCLELLQVEHVNETEVLEDGYCKMAPVDCKAGQGRCEPETPNKHSIMNTNSMATTGVSEHWEQEYVYAQQAAARLRGQLDKALSAEIPGDSEAIVTFARKEGDDLAAAEEVPRRRAAIDPGAPMQIAPRPPGAPSSGDAARSAGHGRHAAAQDSAKLKLQLGNPGAPRDEGQLDTHAAGALKGRGYGADSAPSSAPGTCSASAPQVVRDQTHRYTLINNVIFDGEDLCGSVGKPEAEPLMLADTAQGAPDIDDSIDDEHLPYYGTHMPTSGPQAIAEDMVEKGARCEVPQHATSDRPSHGGGDADLGKTGVPLSRRRATSHRAMPDQDKHSFNIQDSRRSAGWASKTTRDMQWLCDHLSQGERPTTNVHLHESARAFRDDPFRFCATVKKVNVRYFRRQQGGDLHEWMMHLQPPDSTPTYVLSIDVANHATRCDLANLETLCCWMQMHEGIAAAPFAGPPCETWGAIDIGNEQPRTTVLSSTLPMQLGCQRFWNTQSLSTADSLLLAAGCYPGSITYCDGQEYG